MASKPPAPTAPAPSPAPGQPAPVASRGRSDLAPVAQPVDDDTPPPGLVAKEPAPSGGRDAEAEVHEDLAQLPETGEEASEGEATPPEFSDELRERALDLGLANEDLHEFGSNEEAERALDLMERRLVGVLRAPAAPAAEKPAAPAAPAAKTAAAAAPADEDTYQDLPDLSADGDWEPEFRAGWKAVRERDKARHAQVKELKAKLDTALGEVSRLTQFEMKRQKEAFTERFDSYLDGMGEEYHPLIGKGAGSELDERSPEMAARLKILEHMDDLAGAYELRARDTGRPMPSEKVIFNRAVQMALGERTRQLERNRLAQALAAKARQRSIPPTRKATRPERSDPIERATAAVAEQMVGMGAPARD